MITKIKWKNHEVLGNLEIDLKKNDGTPFKTVVLAGENGCGKTTILKTLAVFLNVGSILPFDYIEYISDDNHVMTAMTQCPDNYGSWNEDNFKSGHHYLLDDTSNSFKSVVANRNKLDSRNILAKGCVFSKARSGFKTRIIESIKTSTLDSGKYDDDTSDDFTATKQLLVDIESQDSSDWLNYSYTNKGSDIGNYEQRFKLYRFKNAFNNFFETIKFERIKTENNSKKICFTKFGKEIEIDDLSTGEQQIVFRGTQLLKNSKSINGGVVLVDEPELSMHPQWQKKILNYYQDLFKENGNQMVQMFFATHSEEVIKTALKDENAIVFVLKNKNGIVEAKRIDAPIILPSITSSEINYLAFDIISTDFHIALFSNVQNSYSLNSIKEVDTLISNHRCYNSSKHRKPSSHTNKNGHITHYETLPVYVRNAIDHPESGNVYSDEELRDSVELLIDIIKNP